MSNVKPSPIQQAGLASFLQVVCSNCDEVISSNYTSERLPTDHFFDVNRRIVAASLAVGLSQEGLGKFSEIIGMPKLHHKTYNAHVKKIHSKMAI